jgi:hypothetical protein
MNLDSSGWMRHAKNGSTLQISVDSEDVCFNVMSSSGLESVNAVCLLSESVRRLAILVLCCHPIPDTCAARPLAISKRGRGGNSPPPPKKKQKNKKTGMRFGLSIKS